MSTKGNKKIRQSQRQKLSYRLLVTTGIAVSSIVFVLVIYFQFFRNEIIKAENPLILTQDELPTELIVDEAVILPPDTNLREGVAFKIAKPLPQPVTAE
jgi:hypothetical protein